MVSIFSFAYFFKYLQDSELADQVAQLIIADIQNMVSLGSLSNVSQSQSHDL